MFVVGNIGRLDLEKIVNRCNGERVRRLVENKPDIILRELQAELGRAGQPISLAHMARVVKQLGLRLKKSIHATERDTETNRLRREAFVAQLRQVAPEDLIYLDESGVSTQMTRVYARAPIAPRMVTIFQ